ncbi:BF3164 family lipoprotein [Roseivirga misakiensis]|uniref:DUF4221 domain-containing protein n=1 Tax=Roseivirga misakiensis TaxID=1563681 RepID=A0A1E5T4V4_9BACT|nr:BF3164 family lipoprotein [Roseivirga misakiensis]OEK06398.1 hypothetical protein BFP71_01595 [Roseivirga misakiensis]
MKRYILPLTAILLLGCETKVDKNFSELTFEETYDIKGERVLENELSWIVDVVDDYIICKQNSSDSLKRYLTVYDADGLEYLGSVGFRGRNLNEFQAANFFGQSYRKSDEVVIWVNDPPQYRMTAINLTASLIEGDIEIERSIRHDPQLDFHNALFFLDDSTFAAHQPGFELSTNQSPMVIVTNNTTMNIGQYPKLLAREDVRQGERYFSVLDDVNLAMRPDQERFAAAFHYYDRLDIYSINGDLVKSVTNPTIYKEYDARKIFVRGKDSLVGVVSYYGQVKVTTDYIFIKYYGRERKGGDTEDVPTEIRVFDWDGNPKFVLKCTENLASFAIDEERGWLYGHDISQQRYMRYNIGEYMKD